MGIATELTEALGKGWKVRTEQGIKLFDFPDTMSVPELKAHPEFMKRAGMTIRYENLVITDSHYSAGAGHREALKLARARQAKNDVDVDVPREELEYQPMTGEEPVNRGFYTWQPRS